MTKHNQQRPQLATIEIVGIAEIAEIAKVSRQVICNWRNRYDDFPPPITSLKSGPIFRGNLIRKWLHRHQWRHDS